MGSRQGVAATPLGPCEQAKISRRGASAPHLHMNTTARQLPDQLRTPRLVLREPREGDAPRLFDAYTRDPEVTRFLVWRPHVAVDDTETFIDGCVRDWRGDVRRPYVLALHEDAHRPIGMLEARVHLHTVGIGYVLAREHWGHGLMPEAIRSLSEAILSVPSFFRIQATCDIDNVASARTLEKCGYLLEARLERYAVHPNIGPEPRACFLYALCK